MTGICISAERYSGLSRTDRSGKEMVPRDLPEGWDFVADSTETPF